MCGKALEKLWVIYINRPAHLVVCGALGFRDPNPMDYHNVLGVRNCLTELSCYHQMVQSFDGLQSLGNLAAPNWSLVRPCMKCSTDQQSPCSSVPSAGENDSLSCC